MSKPDVVIPYKRASSNELKYVLRSLKNVTHGNVYIIGDSTRFNVRHIPYRQHSNVATNTLNIMNIASNSPYISQDFIWLADDTFILRPIESIGTYHRGRYQTVINQYSRRSYYVDRMKATYKHLLKLGVANPLCYELHIPFLINRTKWNDVRKYIDSSHNKLSVYGNLNNIGGKYMKDVKVRRDGTLPTTFVSTHESSFMSSSVGRQVRELFKEKGQYER